MLSVYVNFLGLNPYTFFGINRPLPNYAANLVWTLEQRMRVLSAMETARSYLEHMLGYHLLPVYHEGERRVHTRSSVRLDTGYIQSLGTLEVTELAPALVDYTTDPAKVLVPTTTDNVHIYHPTTGKEIYVKSRSLVDDVLTLYVPHYALLIDENNPREGWDYDDLNNFLVDVAVRQESVVPQTGHTVSPINARMGYISITEPICQDTFYINYVAGLPKLDALLIRTWVNFAHARMDIQPSEEQLVKIAWLWARDIPKDMPTVQKECPWGQQTGAYQAFYYATRHKLHRASPL